MNLLSGTLAVTVIIGITLMTVSNFNKAEDQLQNITSMHSASWIVDEATRFTDKIRKDHKLSDLPQVNYNNITPDNDFITIEQVNDGQLSKEER